MEIPPLPDDIKLLLAKQLLPQQPPPANQLNNQEVDHSHGNNGVEQAEDVPTCVPFLMNVDHPQIMMEASPILPFQPQLKVCK